MKTGLKRSGALLVLHHFEALKDPRRRKVVHPFDTILLIVFAGTLCGIQGWDELELFAEMQRDWFSQFVDLSAGIPSPDTLERVFHRLDAKVFAQCLTRWTTSLADSLKGEVIAIDGKSLRGAKARNGASAPLHLLHAFATKQRLLLGIERVEGVGGEQTALPAVLALLDVREAVITSDAHFCNRDNAQQILDRGAHYLFTLKNNRLAWNEAAQQWFKQADKTRFEGSGARHLEQEERNRGRSELRSLTVVSASRIARLSETLPKLRSVVRLKRARWVDLKMSVETHIYLSSLPPHPRRLMRVIREHWGIENRLHRALDVVLHEDAAQVRKSGAAECLALVRRAALTLLQRDTTAKKGHGPKLKSRRALLSGEYRTHLFSLGNQ